MTDTNSASPMENHTEEQSSKPRIYEITPTDLPLHCPLDSMSLWNAHPRVYLPVEETGHAICPYCGTEYTLK